MEFVKDPPRDTKKHPTTIRQPGEDHLLVYFQLVEHGYAKSLSEARDMTAHEVVQCLHRIKFKSDWENKYVEMNKNG